MHNKSKLELSEFCSLQMRCSLSGHRLDVEARAVALGYFDGVHRGHSRLLKTTIAVAAKHKIRSAVFTFSNLPLKSGGNQILSSEEKITRLYQSGIDEVVAVKWEPKIYNLSPRAFVDEVLLQDLHAQVVICGRDFHFGKNAEGNIELLQKMAGEYGFEVVVVDDVEVDGIKVSSSVIREQISSGDVSAAGHYLGYPYYLKGQVISGQQLGRKLGFPTLNLQYPDELCKPHFGVYASQVLHGGECLQAVSSVGIRPTVNSQDHNVLLETYVYDREFNLYGEEITVELLSFIRDEIKFASVEELRQQVERDKQNVLAYHLNKS